MNLQSLARRLLNRAFRSRRATPIRNRLHMESLEDRTVMDTGISGGGVPFNNIQPTLTLEYAITLQGVYPAQGGGDPLTGDTEDTFVGEIRAFTGNFAPKGSVLADGRLMQIDQNAALFSLLGTTYGGDGITTFALPDLRGTAATSSGQAPGLNTVMLGQPFGSETTTMTAAQLPAHDHTIASGTTGITGSNAPFDNAQPTLGLNYIINGDGEMRLVPYNFAPLGWAFADGQLLSTTDDSALFAKIGTTYGGDGVNTFALPDLRDRLAVGMGQGAGLASHNLGDQYGSDTVTLTDDQLPSHTHTTPSGDTGADGGGQPFDDTQPTLALNYGIADFGIFPTPGGGGFGTNLPVLGEIDAFATPDLPTGFLPADGRLISITQDPVLFNLIGTTYGGDGVNTFALPDLRGRAIVEAGQGPGLTDHAVGDLFGEEQHTLTVDEMAPHSHTLPVLTSAGVDGAGNLIVSDTTGNADNITVSFDGGNIILHDPNNPLAAGPGATQTDPNTITIPFASITGPKGIEIDSGDGIDTITLDLTGNPTLPPGGITYDGGNPTTQPGDKLIVTGGSFTHAAVQYLNSSDGTITLDSDIIHFKNLEPVDMTGVAVSDLVFNLPMGPNDALLEDFGASGDGNSQLFSNNSTFESTAFSNPTNSLTINPGSAADTLSITDLPDFDASFKAGSSPFASITVSGAFKATDATLFAGDVNSTLAGTITTTSGLTIEITGIASTLNGIVGGASATLVKQGTGTLILAAVNTYGGTTTVSDGVLLVDGTVAGDASAAGGTLGGNGSIVGAASVNAGGAITGGTLGGVGTLKVGSLIFNGGTYQADCAGDTSDSIQTAGAVLLTNPSQGFFNIDSQTGIASANTVFVLIDKTGTGSIATPPLSGAAESGAATIDGAAGRYTYAGGIDGNDFTFTVTGSPTKILSVGGDYTLLRVRSGSIDNLRLLQGSNIIDSRPFASVTSPYNVTGSNADDTLNIDYTASGGYFPIDVHFDGGPGTDALNILGGTFDTIVYNPTNANDGTIQSFSATLGNSTVTYTGLEPILDTGAATDVIFNLPAGPNTAVLEDDGTPGNGLLRIRSANAPATFETTTFTKPANSLTINRGASPDDTLEIDAISISDFDATLTAGSTGSRFANIDVAGAITSNGSISLYASGTGPNGIRVNGLLKAATTVTLDAGTGAITTAGTGTDVAAPDLLANATTGIDLDTQITNLTAKNTGAGDITIDETDDLNVLSAKASSGNVTISSASGDLDVTLVMASGDASLTATTGAIAVGAITGANINLTAGTSISGAGAQTTDGTLTTNSKTGTTLNGMNNTVAMFNATNGTSGAILFDNTKALLTITGISQAGGGTVTVDSNGDVKTTGLVKAEGGDIALTATAGKMTLAAAVTNKLTGGIALTTIGGTNDLLVQGAVTTDSGAIGATATGAITESAGGFFGTSGTVTAVSANGQTLGDANAVGTFDSTNTTLGAINLVNTASLLQIVKIEQNAAGALVNVQNTGGVRVSSAGVNAIDGGISLSASGGAMTLDAAVATSTTGTIQLTTTGTGNAVTVNALVTTGTGNITTTAGGAITETGGHFDTDGTLTANSAGGQALGNANTIGLFNSVNSGGNINLNNIIPLTLTAVSQTGGGSVAIGNTGTLTVLGGVIADSGNVGLTAAGVTGAINLLTATSKVKTGGAVTLKPTAGVNENSSALGVIGGAIDLQGGGTFALDNANNDAVGVFRANVSGQITFRDLNDLTLDPAVGVTITGNKNLTLYAGTSFTADANSATLVNVGTANVLIVPGFASANPTVFKFHTEIVAGSATFGSDGPGSVNTGADTFEVRPSRNVAINVIGNDPVNTVPGDSIFPFTDVPLFQGVHLAQVKAADGFQGSYTITYTDGGTSTINFKQIEAFDNLAFRAIVAQTDAGQYSVRLQVTQGGQFIDSSINGASLAANPFVVSPNLVNPLDPFSAPSLAIGDVNGDGMPDLVIGNGSNDVSQVTVLDGNFLFGRGTFNLSSPPPGSILGTFYAFPDALGNPTFRGGVSVAVRSNGAGKSGDVIVGPGPGGGPVVEVWQVVSQNSAILKSSFFAYEPNFRGGVNVATGDFNNNGTQDIIVGTGPGGGPRVRVFDNGNPFLITSDFFAYDPSFRGGVLVAAGNFNGKDGADILTAPGFGGGPHIEVWGLTGGTLGLFASFYAWDPNPTNGLQTLGASANNGIGGIAFGASPADAAGVSSGRQEILVSSARGAALQMQRFTFATAADLAPTASSNLYDDLTVSALNGTPILDPVNGQPLSEAQLFQGGGVGGFEVG